MESTESANSSEGVLYFAYGSNLSPTQMQARCPLSSPIGLAHLPGWTWLINERGYANIAHYQNPIPSSPSNSSPPYFLDPSLKAAEERFRAAQIQRKHDEEKGEHGVATNPNEKESEGSDVRGKEGVYGILYRMHPDDEYTLDRLEVVPWVYERVLVNVTRVSAPTAKTMCEDETGDPLKKAKKTEEVQAYAYVDFSKTLSTVAKGEYVDRMNRGISEAMDQWGLPQSYVDAVMRHFVPAVGGEEKGKAARDEEDDAGWSENEMIS
ncbi:hypothetical protein F5Y06DRAFT_92183 [Hypoxylon sp. FL0890]|nr:hypothetical protein F5Y06DRAFT_92183 [Hypoxylon sp. FL0890]